MASSLMPSESKVSAACQRPCGDPRKSVFPHSNQAVVGDFERRVYSFVD